MWSKLTNVPVLESETFVQSEYCPPWIYNAYFSTGFPPLSTTAKEYLADSDIILEIKTEPTDGGSCNVLNQISLEVVDPKEFTALPLIA